MDYYETLGVERTASPEEIKKAYKRMVKKHHPDRAANDEERVARNKSMVLINRAYEALSDPKKREHYDRTGGDAPKDSIEQQALQVIFQILSAMLNQAPETANFITGMRKQLHHNKRSIGEGKANLERQIRKTEKQRKCIKRKKKINAIGKVEEGPNLLDQIFEQRIQQMQKQIADIPEAIKIADKALEILKDYEDATSEAGPPVGGITGIAALLSQMQGRGF